jgi:hypothetical protein
MNTNLWWGYQRINGTVQVKRYFDERDLQDAHESPFCREVYAPFSAADRDDAIKQIEEKIYATTKNSA